MMGSLLFSTQPSVPTLFAAGPGSTEVYLGIIFVLVALVVFGFIILLMKQFKRCPSNRVLVIYGRTGGRDAVTCIHGGARFIKPLLEDYAWLSLDPIQIEIALRGARSKDNVHVDISGVFTVAIGTTPEHMQNAAARLVGQTSAQISKQAEDMIVTQLRQVIASLPIDEISPDRGKFPEAVQNALDAQLGKFGLVLINVNVIDIVSNQTT
jgi:flotillin